MDEFFPVAFVDFAPKSCHLDVDDVVERGETFGLFPDVVLEHFSRHDLALVTQQVFEDVDLAGGEGNLAFAAPCEAGPDVELEILAGERGRERGGATQERAAAGDEFGEGEWFGQVVVGAAFQAGDTVVDAGARGEHEDGNVAPFGTELSEQLKAAATGEHPVEHDEIEVAFGEKRLGLDAVRGGDGFPALKAESLDQGGAGFGFVLHDQHARLGGNCGGGIDHGREEMFPGRQVEPCRRSPEVKVMLLGEGGIPVPKAGSRRRKTGFPSARPAYQLTVFMQKTLIICKPDCMEQKHVGNVVDRFEKAGFEIVGCKMARLTSAQLREHYAHVADKPFYPEIEAFMSSRPVIILALQGEDVVAKVRELLGPTDSRKAAKGTIRGDFGTEMMKNVVHASDSEENGKIEIARFFKADEIFA